jgi:protein-disulfide isomerase
LAIAALFVTGAILFSISKKETIQKDSVAVEMPSAVQQTAIAPQSAPETPLMDVVKMMQDRPIGSETAPITVIEYASMTCPHCAQFNNDTLPIIKKELVETGKIRMIYRDFPFDKFAIKAAMLSRCAPPEKYHEVVDAIFREQAEWIKSADPIKGLTDIGLRAGMDAGFIGMCFGNPDLEEAIIAAMKEAQTSLQVARTPSFFFKQGEEWLDSYPEFTDILNKNAKDEHAH